MGLGPLVCGCVRHSGNSCQTESLLYNRKTWITRYWQAVWFPHPTPCIITSLHSQQPPTPTLPSSPQGSVPSLCERCLAPSRKSRFRTHPDLPPPGYSQSQTLQFGVLKTSQEKSSYIQNCKMHLPPRDSVPQLHYNTPIWTLPVRALLPHSGSQGGNAWKRSPCKQKCHISTKSEL